MKLLRKIFGKQKSKFENFIKSTISVKLCVSQEVFSHGWNDPSEIMKKNGVTLELIDDEDDKVTEWNQYFFKKLPNFYSLSYEQVESIKDIINVDPENYRELYDYWPKEISSDKYTELYSVLKLDFVKSIDIPKQFKNKFILIFNYNFWNYTSESGHDLLVDMINSYEREFMIEDIIFDDVETAIDTGILFVDDLCNSRGPNNVGYFEDILEEEISKLDNQSIRKKLMSNLKGGLEVGYFSFSEAKPGNRHQYYKRSIEEFKPEIKRIKEILIEIKRVPFFVYKLEG